MKISKVTLLLSAFTLAFCLNQASGAVAYTNLPPNPPFYDIVSSSTINGNLEDGSFSGNSFSIAQSFVPTITGTLSAVTLGITFDVNNDLPPPDGNVNVFLASNPMTVGPNTVFTTQFLLGMVTATQMFGTTDSALTTLSTTPPLPIFSGNTYYLLLVPADPNTLIRWNGNITGATSDYFFSTDLGATFTFAGNFGSDALQVDVVNAIPEPATWFSAALIASVLVLFTVRRANQPKEAPVRVRK